jgi:hypothetical protein
MIAARLLFSESVASRITLLFLPSVKGSSSSIVIVNHSMQVSSSSIMMESPVTMEGSEAAEAAPTHDDVYSEWKLSLKSEGAQRVVVNSNYQNTDFRSPHHGMSVIDPVIYLQLLQNIASIWRNLSCQLFGLLFLLLFCAIFLPLPLLPLDETESAGFIFLVGLVVSWGLALIAYHFLSKVLFRRADAQMMALVETYQTRFKNDYDVELRHVPSTMVFRWWTDNSGISLRRPRRDMTLFQQVQAYSNSEVVQDELANAERRNNDNNIRSFPPVFVSLAIPGDIHVGEQNYDATTMKVNATIWAMLQQTHKEVLSRSFVEMCCGASYCILLILFMMTCFWWVIEIGFWPVFMAWIVFIGLAYGIARLEDRRNLRGYEEVSRRVSEALQKMNPHDEYTTTTTSSPNLAVEFTTSELPGRPSLISRRYQFVVEERTNHLATTSVEEPASMMSAEIV